MFTVSKNEIYCLGRNEFSILPGLNSITRFQPKKKEKEVRFWTSMTTEGDSFHSTTLVEKEVSRGSDDRLMRKVELSN